MLHHISVHISKSTISKPIIRKIISWAVQHISRIIPDGVEEAAVVWRDHSPHNNTFHFSPTQLGSVLRITETAKEDSEPRSARMGSCILASARSQPTHFTPCKKKSFFHPRQMRSDHWNRKWHTQQSGRSRFSLWTRFDGSGTWTDGHNPLSTH
jgi:hypothetical protein